MQEEEPRYPLSFDELAELIATGAEIPGIKQIPDKLNEAAPTKPIIARNAGAGRKPWESLAQNAEDAVQVNRSDDTSSLASLLGNWTVTS